MGCCSAKQERCERTQQCIQREERSMYDEWMADGERQREEGDLGRALESYTFACDVAKVEAPNTRQLAKAYQRIGGVHAATGDYEFALQLYKRSLSISEGLSPKSLVVASLHTEIAKAHAALQDHPQAIVSHNKSLAIYLANPSAAPLADTYTNLAASYLKLHPPELTKAASAFTSAISAAEGLASLDEASAAALDAAYRGLASLSRDQDNPQLINDAEKSAHGKLRKKHTAPDN